VADAPELVSYRDEPAQMPSGSTGKDGALRLRFERRGERSALVDLYRRAPLLVQQALYWDEMRPTLPCVFVISTSGCVVQGDRASIDIEVCANAEAHVTTQAATKIHSMDANYATQVLQLVLGKNAYLEYLPQPMIPHKHARFLSETRITLGRDATLLYSEVLLPGRKYHARGELFDYDIFISKVCARRHAGEELFIERLVIEPRAVNMRASGVMGPFDVFGNVLLLTPMGHAERILEQLPAVFNLAEHWAAGASRLPNEAGLVYKVLGKESAQVRAKVREFWSLTRQEILGVPPPREFLWQ
jgi:urease accessory protein